MKKILALILCLMLVFALALPAAEAFAESIVATPADSIVQTMREQIMKAALEFITAAVVALFGWCGVQAKNLYRKHVNTEIKQNVCRSVVRFVEQVYTDLHGQEKLREAMERASRILETYSIYIGDEELQTLLESAVNEFNNSFKKTDPAVKAKAELTKGFSPKMPEPWL